MHKPFVGLGHDIMMKTCPQYRLNHAINQPGPFETVSQSMARTHREYAGPIFNKPYLHEHKGW
jgi:hypothetical protein